VLDLMDCPEFNGFFESSLKRASQPATSFIPIVGGHRQTHSPRTTAPGLNVYVLAHHGKGGSTLSL